jgi:DTW domain-containing protein
VRCERCLLQYCLCAEIPTIATATRVVIVRHHREIFRGSNTGRLAHFALPNSDLIDHGVVGAPATLPPLDGAWLVFPDGQVAAPPISPPPRAIVMLDATWSQARRMFRKIPALRGLPVLRLPEGPMPVNRLRESPALGMVSTIEAIARALRLLEGEAVAAPLERLFEVAVARMAQSGRQMR